MLIPEGYAQVNLKFGGVALPLGAEITFGVALGDSAYTALYVAENAITAYEGTVMPWHSINTTLVGCRAKLGPNATGGFGDVSGTAVGEGTGEALPPSVAIMAEKVTAFGGRRGRGRMYLPGIDEDSVDMGGVVDPANVSGINTALAGFLAALATNDIAM